MWALLLKRQSRLRPAQAAIQAIARKYFFLDFRFRGNENQGSRLADFRFASAGFCHGGRGRCGLRTGRVKEISVA